MKTSHCIVERVDFDVSMCASPDFCIRDDISEFPRREYVCGAFTLRPYLVVNIIKITEWGQHIFQSTLIYQFLHENYKLRTCCVHKLFGMSKQQQKINLCTQHLLRF